MGSCKRQLSPAYLDCLQPQKVDVMQGRTFPALEGKGIDLTEEDALPLDAATTALVMIEFQNEFCDRPGSSPCPEHLLKRAASACAVAREKGILVIHVTETFSEDMSDNPQNGPGVLGEVRAAKRFVRGTHSAAIVEAMTPEQGDIVVTKQGLNAFVGSLLEHQLLNHGIESLAIGGFLRDCCVEATARAAYDKGFNVITLLDCMGPDASSLEDETINAGPSAMNTRSTFALFSNPMLHEDFLARVQVGRAIQAWTRTVGVDKTRCLVPGRHGDIPVATKSALVMIEFQNEFCDERGKLHHLLKDEIHRTNVIENAARACELARSRGMKVLHVGINFSEDMSDNPQRGLGQLGSVFKHKVFIRGSFGSEFCKEMEPKEKDIVILGKRCLDSFPGSELEDVLLQFGIEHIAFGGFLANCCVEGSARTAYEKGFNVFTLTDCVCTLTEDMLTRCLGVGDNPGTYSLFSQPVSSTAFFAAVK